MLILTGWLAIMAAAGLCYPRRPRTAGLLFLAAGGFMVLVWTTGALGSNPPWVGLTSATLGLGTLWRFRDPIARDRHVAGFATKD